ncbi:hypothetical protein ACP4OV_009940 [Aristida adscensionis]
MCRFPSVNAERGEESTRLLTIAPPVGVGTRPIYFSSSSSSSTPALGKQCSEKRFFLVGVLDLLLVGSWKLWIHGSPEAINAWVIEQGQTVSIFLFSDAATPYSSLPLPSRCLDPCEGRRGGMDALLEPMNMTYELLKDITNGFSRCRILGRGTFGVVYKNIGGVHKDGQEIAVKLLHYSITGVDDKEFLKEFHNLTRLNHQNIVKLIGFCNEAEDVPTNYEGKFIVAQMMHRALCFEYMCNGSLQKHLYDEHQGFGWRERYKIIKGICEGLKHLHMGLEGPVYHLDLKPENILLDNNMMPKIADFGLSRLLGEDITKKTISLVGTLGYCPPEFIDHQIISRKFDIFSLGVIIIKIMCGTEGYSFFHDMGPDEFINRKQQMDGKATISNLVYVTPKRLPNYEGKQQMDGKAPINSRVYVTPKRLPRSEKLRGDNTVYITRKKKILPTSEEMPGDSIKMH